jgi:hypothetical protein
MKRLAALLIVMSAVAVAQSSNGYVFVAPGGVTCCGHTESTIHLGGGGDIILAKGLGVNLEIGALAPRHDFYSAVGVFSPGGACYFRRGKDLKLEPFVNGGYSLMFRSGHQNLFYFGGGVNYWLARRVGLRFELRDHVSRSYETAHFWGFRLGLALR